MFDAQFGELAGRMQRIRQQQQAIALGIVRHEHRCRAPTHRATTEYQYVWPQSFSDARHDGGPALEQLRHRIRAARATLPIQEVEPDRTDPALAQGARHPKDRAVVHLATGAVRTDEHDLLRIGDRRQPRGPRWWV